MRTTAQAEIIHRLHKTMHIAPLPGKYKFILEVRRNDAVKDGILQRHFTAYKQRCMVFKVVKTRNMTEDHNVSWT